MSQHIAFSTSVFHICGYCCMSHHMLLFKLYVTMLIDLDLHLCEETFSHWLFVEAFNWNCKRDIWVRCFEKYDC